MEEGQREDAQRELGIKGKVLTAKSECELNGPRVGVGI